MTVAPEQAGALPQSGGACSLRPWWHAESRPAHFPTAHTIGRAGGLATHMASQSQTSEFQTGRGRSKRVNCLGAPQAQGLRAGLNL
jgi:hypothetical protein